MDIQVNIEETPPAQIEIIIDEFASQRAVDAADMAQEILDNIQEIIGNVNLPNILISVNVQRNGNVFTIDVIWRWNGLEHNHTLVTTIATEPGNSNRIDRIVATSEGTVIKLVGDSSLNVAVPPQMDLSQQIEVTQFLVSGVNVGDGTGIVVGNPYIEKNVYAETTAYAGNGKLLIQNSSNYILLDPIITEIKGLILGDSSNSFGGKPVFITNKTDHDITLRNTSVGVDVALILPNAEDFILKKGFSAMFIGSSDGDVEGSLRLVESGYGKINNEELLSPNAGNSAVLDENNKIFVPVSSGGGETVKEVSHGIILQVTSSLYGGYNYSGISGNTGPNTISGTVGGYVSSVLNIDGKLLSTDAAAGSTYALQSYTGSGDTWAVTNNAIMELIFYSASADTVLVSTSRKFGGFSRYGYTAGNMNYSILSVIGFLNDTADSNVQVCYLNASGVSVKIDCGVDFPARYLINQHFYRMSIKIRKGKFIATITDLVTGKEFKTDELAFQNFGCAIHWAGNNNTNALALKEQYLGFKIIVDGNV